VLPTGQVVGRIEELPSVAEVIEGVITEASRTLHRLQAADQPIGSGAETAEQGSAETIGRGQIPSALPT
jgi:hypothetical protein